MCIKSNIYVYLKTDPNHHQQSVGVVRPQEIGIPQRTVR